MEYKDTYCLNVVFSTSAAGHRCRGLFSFGFSLYTTQNNISHMTKSWYMNSFRITGSFWGTTSRWRITRSTQASNVELGFFVWHRHVLTLIWRLCDEQVYCCLCLCILNLCSSRLLRLDIDGLAKDCSNSIADALESLLSCAKLSIWTCDIGPCTIKHPSITLWDVHGWQRTDVVHCIRVLMEFIATSIHIGEAIDLSTFVCSRFVDSIFVYSAFVDSIFVYSTIVDSIFVYIPFVDNKFVYRTFGNCALIYHTFVCSTIYHILEFGIGVF